ncbi:tyrosinase family protein [Sorangium atrum]|uniref:Tyrosinase family protein n=1 Tax=Sorangium atrum TaxID=2995308 RepID=A0ABT5C395_9BACT|nr:tyrosinase family protein [Sorangium aterium]MDC0679657.1 tyrosinase family protein [Sorangium aterium]
MTRELHRRAFVRGMIAAASAAWLGLSLGCGADTSVDAGDASPGAQAIVRKSASAMTSEEIDRFERAYEYAVASGFFDVFNDEHYDHHRHRHHGADLQATSPMTIMVMDETSGYRLLPWHRAFLLEAEQMLRAALRQRDQEEGMDPSEADLLFIPYWDAAHDQDLPHWVHGFEPKGGTAIVPPGLPEGHAGYGKAVGERYDIVFGRWPGKNLVFDTLQAPEDVERILAERTFADFYDALDVTPELRIENYPKAQAALDVLEVKLPDSAAVQTLVDAFGGPPSSSQQGAETTNALFEIGWIGAVEAQKAAPDTELVGAVKDVYSLFNFMPHVRMHLWAGGLDPANADVRGTVTYFNELTVDPVFWMLHGELDRYWYTWEKTHADEPPLEGDDRSFNPLTASEGAWYGGGETYTLDDLTAHDALPYVYDVLFDG